jgi:hypothetical protein
MCGQDRGPPEGWARTAVTLWHMRVLTGAVLDLCAVLVFVGIGRASHGEGDTAAGLGATAWPFLTGLVIGWVITRAWRRPTAIVPTGLGVWLATVAAGMILRALSGQGIALTFVIVSLVFLGVTMLGWRAVATRLRPLGA